MYILVDFNNSMTKLMSTIV